jgi:hypothetical protein
VQQRPPNLGAPLRPKAPVRHCVEPQSAWVRGELLDEQVPLPTGMLEALRRAKYEAGSSARFRMLSVASKYLGW